MESSQQTDELVTSEATEEQDTVSIDKEQKHYPWLRPMVGLFSMLTGLLYLLAAVVGFGYRMMIEYFVHLTSDNRAAEVGARVKQGMTEVDANKAVDDAVLSYTLVSEHFGSFYVLVIALVGGVSLMLVLAGLGMILKKNWSVPMGRLACLLLMVGIVVFFVFTKQGVTEAVAYVQTLKPEGESAPFGWMAAIRYMFLFCMCPIALLVSYGAVVRQYVGKE